MFLENKLPLQDILVTMNIPICNIVNYISDDEMIDGCTDRIGDGERYILEDWCWRSMRMEGRKINNISISCGSMLNKSCKYYYFNMCKKITYYM